MEITHSPQAGNFSQGAFISTRLEEAVESEETDQKLGSFAQSFEAHLQSYYLVLKRLGMQAREKIDVQINELIFQLDGDVCKVRSGAEGNARLWATAMEKIITELAEIPYTFSRNAMQECSDKEADTDDDIISPVSVSRGALPAMTEEQHEAAVYQTWRRYLSSTELQTAPHPCGTHDGDEHAEEGDGQADDAHAGMGGPVHGSPHALVSPAVYARWEASFALVDSLATTDNTGQHSLAVAAYVDLLMATVRQLQCFATGTRREEAHELAALNRCEQGDDREKLLQEVTENLLFSHQVWWWYDTKLTLVRDKIAEYDTAHGPLQRAKGEAAARAHATRVADWSAMVADAETAAGAVVAATREDTTTVCIAMLRHDIAAALSSESTSSELARVQVTCRVITRAMAFFLRSLPDAFYASPCGAGTPATTSEACTRAYLRGVLREALRPTVEDALDHAEEWFTSPAKPSQTVGDEDEDAVPPKRAALRAIVKYVEHYWGTDLTESDDIVQTLKRL